MLNEMACTYGMVGVGSAMEMYVYINGYMCVCVSVVLHGKKIPIFFLRYGL